MKKLLLLTLILATAACVDPVPRYRIDVPDKYATPSDVPANPPQEISK